MDDPQPLGQDVGPPQEPGADTAAGLPRRHDGPDPGGSAGVHRATAAALADLAERRAQAAADLDRALAARLSELDRAIEARATAIKGLLGDAESGLADARAGAVAELKHAGRDERRLLQESAAAQLADLERAVREHLSEIEGVAFERLEALRELMARIRELEQAAASRIDELEGRLPG